MVSHGDKLQRDIGAEVRSFPLPSRNRPPPTLPPAKRSPSSREDCATVCLGVQAAAPEGVSRISRRRPRHAQMYGSVLLRLF